MNFREVRIIKFRAVSGRILTSILPHSGYHHPGSDPVLQRERGGHAGPLQLLRVRVNQLREARVHEGVLLASERRQRIHGARVHSEESPLVQSCESRLRQVEELGFGQDPRLSWRGVCWDGWMRGGSLRAAVRHRTSTGAPAVIEARGRTVAVRPLLHVVRQERFDAKVSRFLHGGGHSAPRRLQLTADVNWFDTTPVLDNILHTKRKL